MASCETIISKDIAFECDQLVNRGFEADGVIINRSDVDFSATVFDETNKNIIKTLVLKTGKKGYQVQQYGNTPFTGTNSALVVGTYVNTWTHQVVLAVLSNTPDVAASIIDGLANGTFVVILRNRTKGADGKAEYQVYGYAQGLKASAGENDRYSEDYEGGWLITLEETAAPKSAMFLFDTDAETTQAKYESLFEPSEGDAGTGGGGGSQGGGSQGGGSQGGDGPGGEE